MSEGFNQRDQRGMAPAGCRNWGEWGLKEYKLKGSFLVGTRDFFLPWLPCSAHYKILFTSLYAISVYVSPSPSNLGRQSCRAACL